MSPHIRLRLNVGLKVAAMVIAFEIVMLVAYTIITQFILDEQDVLRILNLSNRNFFVIALVASLVLAGWLTYMVITRIFSPVSLLIQRTERIIKGDLDMKIDLRTNDELQVLAERFNAMTEALRAERATLENKVRERTRALEEVQKKQLDRQNEVLHLKDEFLFVAAHELRTPVTSIRWSLESVSDRRMNADVREACDNAMAAARGLSVLVDDLLNMARLDAKRIPFKKEFVNAREAVRTACRALAPVADKAGVQLSEDAVSDAPLIALADERRVAEVLTNLIGNAVKYNRKGGHVTVRASGETGIVRLDVIDDGPGIPPEDQKHVFEKFWRAAGTSQVEGSGLGLFIAKRLVDGMNGEIGFASAPGKGTTFTVRLPLAQA